MNLIEQIKAERASGADWITEAQLARITATENALIAADELARAVVPVSYIHNDVISDSVKRRDEAYGNEGLSGVRQIYLDARRGEQERLSAALAAYRAAIGAT